MLEAVLALVVVALLIERFLGNRSHDQEVARLTNAVIAKTAGELHMLDEFWVGKPDQRPIPEPREILDGYEGQAGLS